MSRGALYLCAALYVLAAIGPGTPIPLRVTFLCYAIANVALGFAV